MTALPQDAAIRTGLDAVRRPIESAAGLANGFYTDPRWFEAEKQTVFADNWTAIGFDHDVSDPGMAVPIRFLGEPLLLVRDRQGTLRVFFNVCRHRGMVLIEAPTRLGSVIRCPYHAWCYNQDGSLRGTPHIGGPGCNKHQAVDLATLGLIEVRSHVFLGVIFVDFSGTAPAFEEANGALLQRWAEFADRPLYSGGRSASFSLDLAANWKLAVENYCESYHLPFVHPGLNSYSRLEDHYNIVEPGRFSGQGTLVYAPQLDAAGQRFSNFSGLSPKWTAAAEYVALYPNVLLGVHRDHVFAILLEPLAPDRTVERVEIFYADEEMTGPDRADMRETHGAMWREVFAEDISVVEGMQQGRAARGFDGGRFSPVMDTATHGFHTFVAEALSESV